MNARLEARLLKVERRLDGVEAVLAKAARERRSELKALADARRGIAELQRRLAETEVRYEGEPEALDSVVASALSAVNLSSRITAPPPPKRFPAWWWWFGGAVSLALVVIAVVEVGT